jgi:hypothetical protein
MLWVWVQVLEQCNNSPSIDRHLVCTKNYIVKLLSSGRLRNGIRTMTWIVALQDDVLFSSIAALTEPPRKKASHVSETETALSLVQSAWFEDTMVIKQNEIEQRQHRAATVDPNEP